MKIKTFINFLIIFILFQISNLRADNIFFDSKNLKIESNGNIIYATEGKANIPEQKIKIEGNKSIYNKLISELIVTGNVKFFDELNNVYIETEEVVYNELNNTIETTGNTFIKFEGKYDLISKNVLYDRNTQEISSLLDSSVYDKKNNIFNFQDGFLFNTIKEIINSKRSNIIDSDLNEYIFEKVKINLKTMEIAGKEVKIDFIDSFFGNSKNDPLLRGKSTTSNNDETIVYKAVFSTCNTDKKKCRGWELQSDKFIHNKTERIFEYKDSWLKVFDKRLFYFPYFQHPDPSVKRKSGFLTPVYSSSSNLGRAVNIPFFKVISDSKDMTFNPRIYSDGDFILQSEYRQAFKKSKLIADFSFNNDENNTNSHTFLDITGELNEKTSYNMQFQSVTNDNYLKVHSFEGIQDTNILMSGVNPSTLNSYLKIESELDEDTDLNASLRVYEDLTVTDDNDKYQYIFPDFSFSKDMDLDEEYDGNFLFRSRGYQKNYDTNIYEAQVNNDFEFKSYDFFSSRGIVTNYNLLLKNYNTYSKNSNNFEKNNDHELFSTFSLMTEFPLQKKFQDSTNYLKPKIQFNFSPTNGKDISTDSVRLSYGNLFSSNRIGRSDMVEEGKSMTLGLEFEKQNLSNERLLGFYVGNILKDKKNGSMPSKAKLNQTRSDIVGNIFYNPSKNIKFDYNFSYDRDLNFSNYDAITAEFGINNFVTSFDYITENHEIGDSETITNETELILNNEHSFKFNAAKDLKSDFTQYYQLGYVYETDCLSASFEYQKTFYRDGNLVPDESLKFLIRFIPFTELRGSADTIFNNN